MPEPVSEAQLRRIYNDTIDTLYGFASRRCGGQRELAEDVTQEAWLRAVREWPRTGLPKVPLAWLSTVVRNLLLNHFRRRESIPLEAMSPAEVLAAVDDDKVADSTAIAAAVSRALTRVPAAEATLLEAFHYDRSKVSQLATRYGISERAVEGRLRRARQRLRQELEITLKGEGGMV